MKDSFFNKLIQHFQTNTRMKFSLKNFEIKGNLIIKRIFLRGDIYLEKGIITSNLFNTIWDPKREVIDDGTKYVGP